MRKYTCLFFLLLLIFASHQTYAQFPLGKQKAKLSGIRIAIGGAEDLYSNLSSEGLFSMLKPNQQVDFDLDNYEEMGGYRTLMTGGTLGVDLIFNPRKVNGTTRNNREIRVGANIGIEREVMIDVVAKNPLGDPYDNIGLCVIENSFNLEVAYLFKASPIKVLQFYAGPGANLGGTFGNRFLFVGDPSDIGDKKAKNSNYLRAYAVAGATFGVSKIFFQLEGKLGVGTQIVHDGKASSLTSYGLQIGLGYRW